MGIILNNFVYKKVLGMEVNMKATIDAELCIGCQICVQSAPSVFEMKDDKAVTIVDSVPEDAESGCREATDSCPVNAITVE